MVVEEWPQKKAEFLRKNINCKFIGFPLYYPFYVDSRLKARRQKGEGLLN